MPLKADGDNPDRLVVYAHGPTAVDYVGRQYSADLKSVCMYLLSKPAPTKTIDDVLAMLGPRLVLEADSALQYGGARFAWA